MKLNLDGKRALVTGAGRGAGAGIAKAFCEAGAEVLITARNEARLAAVATEIRASGGTVRTYATDLGDRDAVRALAREAGEIDILVNNAAHLLGARGSLLPSGLSEWDLDMAINVTAPLMLMQALVPGMVERGRGNVINISSIGAKMPNPTHLGYAASKAALEIITRGFAVDPVASGVRFNVVALGMTATEIWDDMPLQGITREEIGKLMAPIGRLTEVSEVAALCLFLATDLSAALTGAVITLDGGMTAGVFQPGSSRRRAVALDVEPAKPDGS